MTDSIKDNNVFLKLGMRLKQGLVKLLKEPAFMIYLVAVVIYLPWFLPNLSDIAPWDETYYIVSGREILSGQLPTLAYGPLLSFLYTLSYLPFQSSPFWLIHVNSIGRFLLFSFLFIGSWRVGVSLKDRFNPVAFLGFLFLSPILVENFEYPADPLFAALSAMAFAQALFFLKTKNIKHVWWASFWLGLGMLTRGDALIIMLALTVFLILWGRKSHTWWRLMMAVLIPFLALPGGYVVLRGVVTGDFDSGMAARSYTAFEQGQEVDMPEEEGRFGAATESYYVARQLFGTPEENEGSVFRAIARNPQAYLSRLCAVLKSLPGLFLTAYYRRYTVLLSLLAMRGLIKLVKQKDLPLVMLHLIWFLPLSAGIARTLVRVGYFRLAYFVMFSLAIIGLKAMLDSLGKTREGLVWAGLILTFLLLAFRIDDYAIQFGMTVALCWLLLTYLLSQRATKYPNWQHMAMLLLLAGGLLLRGSFRIYQPRVLGQEPREEAALILREVTEPDDTVLTGTPSVVFLAERKVANFYGADIPEFDSSQDFIAWMASQDFNAIYLDQEAPALLWSLSLEQAGQALTQVYASEKGESLIFLLNQGE